MTPEQTIRLINLLKEKRAKLGLSVNEVARRAEVDPGTAWRIEQGIIAKPRVESLIAIGRVLDINAMELFTTVGWLTANDLPSLGTYLNAMYSELPKPVIGHIEHHVARILHAYEHSAGGRHTSAEPGNCPWCREHSPQHPSAPAKERP